MDKTRSAHKSARISALITLIDEGIIDPRDVNMSEIARCWDIDRSTILKDLRQVDAARALISSYKERYGDEQRGRLPLTAGRGYLKRFGIPDTRGTWNVYFQQFRESVYYGVSDAVYDQALTLILTNYLPRTSSITGRVMAFPLEITETLRRSASEDERYTDWSAEWDAWVKSTLLWEPER